MEVDEVKLNLAITKWKKCTKIINDNLKNLDTKELPIYKKLLEYWSSGKPYDKDYCQSLIDELKPFDKLHKNDKNLSSALKDFRNVCNQFYTVSDSYLKAFSKKMGGAASSSPPPTPPSPVNVVPQQRATPLSRDEMISQWRLITKDIKFNLDDLTVEEQSLYEMLSEYWQNNSQYNPTFCKELIDGLRESVRIRSCSQETKQRVANFLSLCTTFYTTSEDEFRVFQNSIRPRRQRAEQQPVATNRVNPAPQTNRPINTAANTVTTPNTPIRTSSAKRDTFIRNLIISILLLIGVFMYFRSCAGDDDNKRDTPAALTTTVTTTLFKCTSKGLNVRASASSSARVLGTLVYDQKINVVNIEDGFAKIKYGSGFGYVSSKYIKIAANTIRCRCIKNSTRVLAAPSESARFFGQLSVNREVDVVRIENGYAQIVYNGILAYVNSKSLEKVDSNTSSTKASTEKKKTVSESSSTQNTTTAKANTATTTKPTQTTTSTTTQKAKKPTAVAKPKVETPKTAEQYYAEGKKLAINYKGSEAVKMLSKASDMGSVDAQCYLGMMYVNGSAGISKDTKLGFSYVLKAAEGGCKEAIFQVAELYSTGTGVTKDNSSAKFWYQRALDLGDNRAKSRLRKLK